MLFRSARHGIGYVPEERGIFSTLTVEENLTLPPVIAKGGMSLAEIYQLFPNLEERRKSPGTKLSGGEQQRVALARLLAKKPPLILADEPTGALDSENAQMVIDSLREMAQQGATVVVATHSDMVRDACDECLCLD